MGTSALHSAPQLESVIESLGSEVSDLRANLKSALEKSHESSSGVDPKRPKEFAKF